MRSDGARAFRRLITGIGSQGIGLVLVTAVNLVSVPVLLAAWGSEAYAQWMVAFSASSLLALLDLGLHGTFTNRIRHEWSQGQTDPAKRTFRLGLTLYCVPVAIGTVLTIGLTWFTVLPAPFPFLAIGVIAAQPRGIVSCVLAAGGRCALEIWLFFPSVVLPMIAVMVAAAMGSPPQHSAMVFAATGIVAGWLPLLIIVRNLHGDLDWRPCRPRWREIVSTARHAPLFFLPQGATLLLLHGPVLLLACFADGADVVLFTMLRTFTGMVRQVVQQSAIPVGIELAHQHSRRNSMQIRLLRLFSGRLLSALAGLGAGASWMVGHPFFPLWSHGAVAFAPVAAALFLAPTLLTAPLTPGVSLLRHWHDPLPQCVGVALQTGLGLLLCSVLIPIWGVTGAIAGLAAAEVLAVFLFLAPAAARLTGSVGRVEVLLSYGLTFALVAWGAASAGFSLGLVGDLSWPALIAALALWLVMQTPLTWWGRRVVR